MNESERIDDRNLAVIGFGEAGRILAAGLAASGRFDVCAYDILVHDPSVRGALLTASVERRVTMAESHREAIRGARVIVSAVTAASSTDVAREAAAALAPGQIFADINSVSPDTKRANAHADRGRWRPLCRRRRDGADSTVRAQGADSPRRQQGRGSCRAASRRRE